MTSPVNYFTRSDVIQALNIPTAHPGWEECTDRINYSMFQNGTQWIWEAMRGKYRMLKFSGDIDGVVPTQGSLGWIDALNWPVTDAWRSWYVPNPNGVDQLGGFIERRDGMDFATINGAGHMVPQDKPEAAYHLISHWLAGNYTGI